MALAERQLPQTDPVGPHLVLYDGQCGLCHAFVQFVLPRDVGGRFHFASLQGPVAAPHLARWGSGLPRLSTIHLITDYRTDHARCLIKARAALFVLGSLGWPWRAAWVLGVLPQRLLDGGYDLVARYRQRILGRRETCVLPQPEFRERFLDLASGPSRVAEEST